MPATASTDVETVHGFITIRPLPALSNGITAQERHVRFTELFEESAQMASDEVGMKLSETLGVYTPYAWAAFHTEWSAYRQIPPQYLSYPEPEASPQLIAGIIVSEHELLAGIQHKSKMQIASCLAEKYGFLPFSTWNSILRGLSNQAIHAACEKRPERTRQKPSNYFVEVVTSNFIPPKLRKAYQELREEDAMAVRQAQRALLPGHRPPRVQLGKQRKPKPPPQAKQQAAAIVDVADVSSSTFTSPRVWVEIPIRTPRKSRPPPAPKAKGKRKPARSNQWTTGKAATANRLKKKNDKSVIDLTLDSPSPSTPPIGVDLAVPSRYQRDLTVFERAEILRQAHESHILGGRMTQTRLARALSREDQGYWYSEYDLWVSGEGEYEALPMRLQVGRVVPQAAGGQNDGTIIDLSMQDD